MELIANRMMRKPERMKMLGDLHEGLVCWGILDTVVQLQPLTCECSRF